MLPVQCSAAHHSYPLPRVISPCQKTSGKATPRRRQQQQTSDQDTRACGNASSLLIAFQPQFHGDNYRVLPAIINLRSPLQTPRISLGSPSVPRLPALSSNVHAVAQRCISVRHTTSHTSSHSRLFFQASLKLLRGTQTAISHFPAAYGIASSASSRHIRADKGTQEGQGTSLKTISST